ncbi:hypothetical protein DMNBHIDG_00062 [Candidatus Methanoperedenaceae archaeon GB37]|nr:hypothetical protein DMNBHIDG_00062 [Candidatus Methanoperedenaceae archaeon GB37]
MLFLLLGIQTRPPAKAVSFSKKIDEQEKAERLSEVLEIQAPITERKN